MEFHFQRLIVGFATLACVVSTAPLEAEESKRTHETAITMLGSWAVVHVRINDDPAPRVFIVDTAAGSSVIDERLARQLRLPASASGPSEVAGASGDALSKAVVISRLRVSSVSATQVEVVATDMARFGKGWFHYDGILGNDVLRHYAVSIDVPGGVMILSENQRPVGRWSNCEPNALGNKRPAGQEGFVAAKVRLASGGTSVAIIDSGAARTVFNWPAAIASGLSKDSSAVKSGRSVGGFDVNNRTESYEGTIGGLSVGPTSLAPVRSRISDLAVFKGFGLEGRPGIILGLDVLRQRPFGIALNATHFCL